MLRDYLETVKQEQINMPVKDIPVGTMFMGNPKCLVGQLPMFSSSMGEALWVRTPLGVASMSPESGYDGQNNMNKWVIEGYIPVGSNLLEVACHLKKLSVDLLFCAETQYREIQRLKKEIEGLVDGETK